MSTHTDRIAARIDPALKQKAVAIFDSLGLSESEAIRMFYAQVDLHQGIPFEVKIPNAETIAAMEELRENMTVYTPEEFEKSLEEL